MPGTDGNYKYPADKTAEQLAYEATLEKSDMASNGAYEKLIQRVAKATTYPNRPPKPIFTIGLDFDGTVVTHEFPKVGQDCPHVTIVLKEIVAKGAGLILNTMRHGEYLADAVAWFIARDIPLYGVQMHPTQATWTGSNKCYAHLYIDDAAIGTPLIHDASVSKRPFVDWVAVDRLLQEHDWYVEPIHS